jgi:hypothetical protein
MSTRFVVSSLAGVLVLGGVAATTFALVGTADAADAPAKPVIGKSSASSLVLGTSGTKTFTFSTTATDDSGIKSVKVLAWPKSADFVPNAADMAAVESATCKASSATTSVCTYSTPVDEKKDAAGTPTGTWYVAVLVTAKDHDTAFSAKASTFTVERQAG